MTAHELHLTLLRHGRSRADDEDVHEGRYDSPLTDMGRAQAKALAGHWQAHPPGFELAFCSTLARAHETAEIVTAALDVPLRPDDLWREWDNGPLAGLPREEALRRFPIPAFRHDLDPFTAEGGESQAAIRARALLALESVWQAGAANVLVVSHGGFLNSVLRELTGAHRGWFAFGDTGFATVQLSRASHTALLTGVNLTPHLTPPAAAVGKG
ncbi:histidine phosphatase family protein [Deinococcus metallilatus]|uniref:2,3-bisphosphoglycerate-dependent phosphoglycerate mutase n=1 Tax=Deinococcus metallilatus TaxID=1211322 RepID=A0AAJ5F6L0_9DEIO|nr:histidine phosphatase family protein [Deinococcus metallilatus]MBB5294656.1 2,3-bisphosphoglycerate-dependent phosphoglycerate mutase [Deinococcus metallilatus]QBY07692.1 histidine phosphatase family protein [Deinococcus metallilatus]RXJ14108.1 histidine phosphatase family protein [Deinococcus metallilatus]TLK30073.1 histidine phosphatase family protein [Deinococcus metallilatus]GMA15870.1 phosphoglycerate mutase [Deinococcus metallilatus]